MKIAIIGTNGLPAHYGGFETLTHYLVDKLNDKYDFSVYCSKTVKSKRLKEFNGAKLIYFPFRANGYQSVFYDMVSLIHAWNKVDILLVLGNSGALILPFLQMIRKKNIVLNIGGIDWGREKWNYLIKKYIQASEKIAIKCSDIIITDNQHIFNLYQTLYGVDSTLIEYGGDHAKFNNDVSGKNKELYPFLTSKYYVCVARAQEDNNLHIILKTFLEYCTSDNLVIISNWEKSKYGRKLREEYRDKSENIHVLDAIYDTDLLNTIRSCAYCYIHSHSFCGTAPSLVEAMSIGLPVISYEAPTNRMTTENMADYFSDEHTLSKIIKAMTNLRLEENRKHMLGIAKRRYTWDIISRKYSNCFNEFRRDNG